MQKTLGLSDYTVDVLSHLAADSADRPVSPHNNKSQPWCFRMFFTNVMLLNTFVFGKVEMTMMMTAQCSHNALNERDKVNI
jgi:hypothetical protein